MHSVITQYITELRHNKSQYITTIDQVLSYDIIMIIIPITNYRLYVDMLLYPVSYWWPLLMILVMITVIMIYYLHLLPSHPFITHHTWLGTCMLSSSIRHHLAMEALTFGNNHCGYYYPRSLHLYFGACMSRCLC